jgi:murein lipoprotein
MRLNFPKSSAVVLVLVGATALGGCATKGFVREQIATVNTRIDGMDGRLRLGERLARRAFDGAQAAAGQAQQNGQRIDQLNGRVDGLDQQVQQQAQQRARRPRG